MIRGEASGGEIGMGTDSSKRAPMGGRTFLLALAVLATLFMLGARSAGAIEVTRFYGNLEDPAGNPQLQAAAHPDMTIGFDFASVGPRPNEDVKDAEVDLPSGLVIDPSATPKCKQSELTGRNGVSECAPETQVGNILISDETQIYPIYNVVAPPGTPGRFAANVATVLVNLDARVRADDYGITSISPNSSQSMPVTRVRVELWGVPADPAHDGLRFCGSFPGCESRESPRPVISNPSDCGAGPMSTRLRVNSWQQPNITATASFDRDPQGNPLQVTGCENVRFEPELTVQPESSAADTPTAVDATLTIPQNRDPYGLSAAMLNRVSVTFPEGMTVNSSSADGQGSCAPAQIALGTDSPPRCPAASKIATVSIDTPLLEDQMSGAVYLASQKDNPFGSTLAVYLVAEGSGVVIKIPGRIESDPETGRLVTTFADVPQLPFETLHMSFRGGPRAPLVTPANCGVYSTTGTFVPSSALDKDNPNADELRTTSDSFQITSGPNGSPCPNDSFRPQMEAGTTNPLGGDFSPFLLRLTRPDGSERFQGLAVTLPKGLLGKLAGIPYCSDAALAAVSSDEGSGRAQLASPSCPQASELGRVIVGAGAGSNPFYAETGRAYLAGPYKGAPLSLAVIVPALAGPFDLGSVVVRNALEVDPESAQITAVSDPLPTILHGIPLDVRDIRIEIDRQGFTLNPTSCDTSKVTGTARATTGASAALESRFKVLGCGELAFKPKLALSVKGPTHRNAHPAFKAVLTMPKQGANIQKAQVTLPKTELLENAHIRTICTRVQYNAGAGGGTSCPAASIYGKAKAWSPLLDKPLEGPVYLRSSSHQLPDLVASLDGQIHIDLVGRIDAKNARIRNTFEAVPDAPVSRFVLEMQGGKKGLLANNTELCKTTPRAAVKFDAQNGKLADSDPVMRADCGKKARKGAKKRGGRR